MLRYRIASRLTWPLFELSMKTRGDTKETRLSDEELVENRTIRSNGETFFIELESFGLTTIQ